MESLNQEDYEAKKKAFENSLINSWLNTRLERDKQLLSLSVTAIGLLVTLLRTVGASNITQIVFFVLALFAFLITVISVIFILGENSKHIENVLNSSENESKTLRVLDNVAGCFFIAGMLLIIFIGIHSAVINLNEKGANMSPEKSSDIVHNFAINNNNQSDGKYSWNGIAKLRPQPPKNVQVETSTTQNTPNSSVSSDVNKTDNIGSSEDR